MTTIKFNLNHYILVKVLPKGEEIWRKFHDDSKLPPAKYPLPKPNSDGLTRFQLWELMHIFGVGLYNGCDLPINPEIYLLLPDQTVVREPAIVKDEPESSLDQSRQSFGHKDDHP